MPTVEVIYRAKAATNTPGAGYYLDQRERDGVWRWVWVETGEPDSFGEWCATEAAALRDAADDWEASGTGGRLAATLRAMATKRERRAHDDAGREETR